MWKLEKLIINNNYMEDIMKKIVTLALASVLSIAMLTGCATKENGTTTTNATEGTNAESPTQSNEDEASSTTTTETTVTDAKGNKVTVPADVNKAVVMDYGILDSIQALEIDVEVAIPSGETPSFLSDFSDSTTIGSIKEPDLEAIFDFEPDVIFISGRQESFYDQLSEIAPTIYVSIDSAKYMEDFKNNTNIVASIFNKETEADEAIKAIEAKVEAAKAVSAKTDDKALIILTNDGSMSAYGAGSRFGIIHDLLGVKAADDTIEVSTHGQEVSYEYISQVNPDILFVVDRTVIAGGTNLAATTLDNELVNETSAATNNKIISLDSDLWYLSGGGLTSVSEMIDEVVAAIQ